MELLEINCAWSICIKRVKELQQLLRFCGIEPKHRDDTEKQFINNFDSLPQINARIPNKNDTYNRKKNMMIIDDIEEINSRVQDDIL